MIRHGILESSRSKGVAAATYPTRGLVARYDYNDTLNDTYSTKNGWVSMNTPATWSYTADGMVNKAFKFGPTNDVGTGTISNETDASILNLIINTNSFSTSQWIKITNANQDLATPQNWRPTRSSGTSFNWSFGGSAYKPAGDVNGGPFLSGGQYYAADMRDNTYHHYVYTYDGTNARFYIDNVLRIGPVARGSNASSYAWHSFSQQGSWQLVNGYIDLLYYYGVCLTTDEISQLYNNGSGI